MNNQTHLENSIQTFLNAEVEITVSEIETAVHLGSGQVPVYATPALVALMENAAVHALEGHLPDGQTTVGGQIDLRHLAATPVGMKVRAHAELVEVNGSKFTFHIQAWDEAEQIGEANHVRFIIDEVKFMAKVGEKRK
jgi:fluoroacetyl-CoA thioesterase